MFFTRRCLLSSTRSENRREGSVKGGARLATVFSPVISERNGRSASLRGRTWPVSRDGGYFTAPLAFFFFAPFLSSFSRDSPSSLRSTRVSLRFFPPRGGSNVLLFLITKKKKNNGDVPNLCTKHYFKTLRHLRYRWWYVGCFFFLSCFKYAIWDAAHSPAISETDILVHYCAIVGEGMIFYLFIFFEEGLLGLARLRLSSCSC